MSAKFSKVLTSSVISLFVLSCLRLQASSASGEDDNKIVIKGGYYWPKSGDRPIQIRDRSNEGPWIYLQEKNEVNDSIPFYVPFRRLTTRPPTTSQNLTKTKNIFYIALLIIFLVIATAFLYCIHPGRKRRRLSEDSSNVNSSLQTSEATNEAFPDSDNPRGHVSISVIMPREDLAEQRHKDLPPLYNQIFATESERRNSPYILPSYEEIMRGQGQTQKY